ncbi:LysE family translocator [Oleomonas cavernae]|uniref:LysE family translocator n=1 Tax=Oleomonas cavernae TaxID=2320859 RepID=A0A418WER0_9PROT|nr:LysE family translocator [Oleomonas cavernae]RJF88505.1 LysE family translocator [Oleomonas cavernae]
MTLPLDPHLFKLYLVAATVLILIPGPDFLLVLGRSLFEGRQAGWTAIGGITVGNTIHSTLAAAGISALVAASPTLFQVLKLLGAGYLAWLGARALVAAYHHWRTGAAPAAPVTGNGRTRQIFLQALGTNMLNAKVILFYLAFVPQFVSPALGSVALQTFILGLTLAVGGGIYLGVVAAFAARAANRIAANRWFRTAIEASSGVIFIGFALRLVLVERKFV